MTDFYKELNLDNSLMTDDLRKELSKQENHWHSVLIYNPEKATAKLALINQAWKVFDSDATRRTYDRELAESQRTPEKNDPDKDRSEELKKWKGQAESYLESGQYDLAKVAIENALSFSSEIDNDDLYATAARIYLSNNDTAAAMNYINKAIVCAPDVSFYYLLKGFIYDKKAYVYEWRSRNETPLSCWSEERKMYHFSLLKAEQSNDRADLARAYGALAHSYFFEEPQDKEKGKNYAELSLKYGGDANAQPVIDEINKEEQRLKEKRIREAKKLQEERIREAKRLQEEKIREEQERYENELRKKDALYDEALRLSKSQNVSDLQYAIKLFYTISYYKDSNEQIKKIENRVINIEKNRMINHIGMIILINIALIFIIGIIWNYHGFDYLIIIIGIGLIIISLFIRLIYTIRSLSNHQ